MPATTVTQTTRSTTFEHSDKEGLESSKTRNSRASVCLFFECTLENHQAGTWESSEYYGIDNASRLPPSCPETMC